MLMEFKETEIQHYIWEHRGEFFKMIEQPKFEQAPNKRPWEFEPWELLYYKVLDEYKGYYELLEALDLFGCEVRLDKDGESTIRTDLLGCLEGENGFVICELKVNRQPERQAYTELFAYANHIRAKIAPMGRRDIFYLLISPMEERIVREATISNLFYDKNRVVALVPVVGDTIDTLKFNLWIPSKEEFRIFASSAFAPENIDVFRVSWRGAEGKWSPTKKGAKATKEMIHQLNKVSQYAAQLMEANGINGFVFCLQSYPEVRERGFLENGITVCGINPYKATKTKYLLELGASLKEASEADADSLEMGEVLPHLKSFFEKNDIEDDYMGWMALSWSSCLDRIGLEVVKRVNRTFGPATYDHGYGGFTWESYRNRSSEDKLCDNYDISLTGIFRELYDLKLERHYDEYEKYTNEERCDVMERGKLEKHCIDMMYDHDHIRDFIQGLIGEEI